MAILRFLLPVLLLMPSCKEKEKEEEGRAESAQKVATKPVNAPLPVEDSGPITWINNDYDKALAQAKAENKPLVIDMWADWCHTCLAMKKGVLRDRGLNAVADGFVWLAVDTEDPASAAAMEKFPPKVWPSFFVVSPSEESVQATQLGSCSVSAFREFLARGASGHLAILEEGGELAKDSPLAHLRDGDRAWLSGQYSASSEHYAAALALSDKAWIHWPQTQKNRISALAKLEDKKACAALGASELDAMIRHKSSATTDFLYYASSCAEALEKADATVLRLRILSALDTVLADPEASLSYDDRSDALGTSRAIAEAVEDKERAKGYAVTQQKLLAKAVKASDSALAEMTYVWHQVEVHNFLGQGEAILPWVESLETRLPKEYDPPYRKAWLLAQMKRTAEAHKALQVALPLVEGARRGRLLSLEAELHEADGNLDLARKSREAVLAHHKGLPVGLRSQSKIDSAQKALDQMKK